MNLVRFEQYAKGRSAQILHVGSYDDEGPTLARLHDAFLPAHGLVPSGRRQEIYLSDRRKTENARLKTVLQQPVTDAPSAGPPKLWCQRHPGCCVVRGWSGQVPV